MRWIFLLLVMLNAFYYVWYQQGVPLSPKEILPVSPSSKGVRQNIQLVSEAERGQPKSVPVSSRRECVYLGRGISESEARTVEQRLVSWDIRVQFGKWLDDSAGVFWLKVLPESRRLVDDSLLGRLTQDFPELKSRIMSCEAIATSG